MRWTSCRAEISSFRRRARAGVTYAAKISKDETRIDWSLDALALLHHIHGLSPFPGAWCLVPTGGDEVRLKVLRVELARSSDERPGTVLDDQLTIACGNGALRLLEVQREGEARDEARRLSCTARKLPSGPGRYECVPRL